MAWKQRCRFGWRFCVHVQLAAYLSRQFLIAGTLSAALERLYSRCGAQACMSLLQYFNISILPHIQELKKTTGVNIMRLFSALILAFIASLGLMSIYLIFFPGDIANRLIWSGLLFPLLWPALIFYVYWPEKAFRPFAALGLISIISTIAVLIS